MFQEKYDLEDINGLLISEIDIIFLGTRSDERCLALKNKFSGFNGNFVYLESDETSDKLSFIQTDGNDKEIKVLKDIALLSGIVHILNDLNIRQKKVLIDITGIQQVILFLLINRLLTVINPRLLFAAYTEPLNYIADSGSFNLCEDNKGFQNLPGFSHRNEGSNNLLVVILGFETHRLLALLEEVQPAPKKIIPIVGFPAYQPGWKSTSIVANTRGLSDANALGLIYTCEASSPSKMFVLLDYLSSMNKHNEFLLAPLGTRPHALGAAIFASLRKNCIVLYDFPIEKTHRSTGVKNTHIYHLSTYITPQYDTK